MSRVFYRAGEPHKLAHDPFNALIVPRPIGWISSLDAKGAVNLAPYSFFNGVAYRPPQVMFATTGPQPGGRFKDTVSNIRATGEFVVNMATWKLREAMNASAAPAPAEVDEFALAGLAAEPSVLVRPPRVAESPVHLECALASVTTLPSADPEHPNTVVFGEVKGIHIADRAIEDGMVRFDRLDVIGRLGYRDYVRVDNMFGMDRPGWP